MSTFKINDHILNEEADELAREIFEEYRLNNPDDFDPEHWLSDMQERAHECADGHSWVIYTHKAVLLCANCDTTLGEEFLDDCGGVEVGDTFGGIATKIAYGELRGRIERELIALADDYDPDTDTDN